MSLCLALALALEQQQQPSRRTWQLLNCLYQRQRGVKRRRRRGRDMLLLSHLSLVQLVRVITHTSLFSSLLCRPGIDADQVNQREREKNESRRRKRKAGEERERDTRLLTQQDRTLASYTHLFLAFPVYVNLYPRESKIPRTHSQRCIEVRKREKEEQLTKSKWVAWRWEEKWKEKKRQRERKKDQERERQTLIGITYIGLETFQ